MYTCVAIVGVRTQGVNTPYQPSRDGWSYSVGSQASSLLGDEEKDMEAILRDLLATFPTQTRRCKFLGVVNPKRDTKCYLPVAISSIND